MRFGTVVLAVLSALVARADIPVALANPAFEETENGQPRGWRCPPGWKAERCGHNGSGGLAWEFAASADGRPCQPVTLRPRSGCRSPLGAWWRPISVRRRSCRAGARSAVRCLRSAT